jgi:hypothetical protein
VCEYIRYSVKSLKLRGIILRFYANVNLEFPSIRILSIISWFGRQKVMRDCYVADAGTNADYVDAMDAEKKRAPACAGALFFFRYLAGVAVISRQSRLPGLCLRQA